MSESDSEIECSHHENYSEVSTIAADDLDQLEEIKPVEIRHAKSFPGMKIISERWKGEFHTIYDVQALKGDDKGKKYVLEKIDRCGRILVPHVAPLLELKHKNIVELVKTHFDDTSIYLLTEYAPKGTLQQAMSQRRDGKLSLSVASRVFKQVVDGLNYIHGCNYSHGEIHPSSIMVCGSGVYKLCNFRNAKKLRTKNGVSITYVAQKGICEYMAPEILLKEKYRPKCVDLWSLGILLAVMLQGKAPWKLPSVTSAVYCDFLKAKYNKPLTEKYWDGMDHQAFDVIKKLLDRDPKARKMKVVLKSDFYKNPVQRKRWSRFLFWNRW